MSTEMPPAGRDAAAAVKLQILATEHWSLLATRTLTYNESLSRVTIFLSILSGAVIALALVAQVSRFGPAFIAIAIPLLSVVVFTGISTIGRLMQLNGDDFRWVVGMNRLRRAYIDLHPELEPYFTTGSYDDLPGALQTLGYPMVTGRRVGSVLHTVQTLPGMLSVLVASVVGAIGALAALAVGLPSWGVVLIAAAAFVIAMVWLTTWGRRWLRHPDPSLEPRFPSPR
ncbi:MAG: hypothetical protein QOH92_1441 [Chloroflexota bacterium]|jgi:hypothetical protein|nr:hypothetical protein [Chloroflexota bacterium]